MSLDSSPRLTGSQPCLCVHACVRAETPPKRHDLPHPACPLHCPAPCPLSTSRRQTDAGQKGGRIPQTPVGAADQVASTPT